MEIAEDRSKAFDFTIKKNTVAVVSDGSAVLGLGDIGPEAAMPVMEGKAMLFKEFAGRRRLPDLPRHQRPGRRSSRPVKLIAPTFGGINLEDISAPRCFEIEDALKEELDIPVFHDDQHGTAVVTMAALFNALKIVGKPIESLRVLMLGLGAAGVAVTKMMLAPGSPTSSAATARRALDRARGLPLRRDDRDQALVLRELEPREARRGRRRGDRRRRPVRRLSGPGLIQADDAGEDERRRDRLRDGQPDPRGDARGGRALRADHGHRALGLPEPDQQRALLPGDLPRRARRRRARITEEMKLAAAQGIADVVAEEDLTEDYIIPSVFDRDVAPAVAKAVVEEAAPRRDRARLRGDRHLLDDRVGRGWVKGAMPGHRRQRDDRLGGLRRAAGARRRGRRA